MNTACENEGSSQATQQQAHLGNVLVLGLGKSGKVAARYCANLLGTRVKSVFVAAGQENPDAQAFLKELAREGFTFAFGDDAVPQDRSFDLCIASPGIPYWHELYQAGLKASKRLVSELEFAWSESSPNSTWIAITGTNGKTTTTALCAHILQACGYAAAAVGNIGDVCLEAVANGQTSVYVAEVSSYQLASTQNFAPDVAVVLNITPDHLHWHKTLEAYRDAKYKVLANLASKEKAHTISGKPTAIFDAVNDVVRAKVREIRPLTLQQRGYVYIPLGSADGLSSDMRKKCGAENAAFLSDDDHLVVACGADEYDLGAASNLQILGAHNVSNALAAAAAALAVGANPACVRSALQSFEPLEHRIEPCGEIAGVTCINDSKGTNVDSVVKALAAFPNKRIVILLGGEDKGTDLTPLVEAVYQSAQAAVCFGEAGSRFLQAFQDAANSAPAGFSALSAHHMEDALEVALEHAIAGDVVLLSPACASFDEFKNYEERGRVFKQLVAEHIERANNAQPTNNAQPAEPAASTNNAQPTEPAASTNNAAQDAAASSGISHEITNVLENEH